MAWEKNTIYLNNSINLFKEYFYSTGTFGYEKSKTKQNTKKQQQINCHLRRLWTFYFFENDFQNFFNEMFS